MKNDTSRLTKLLEPIYDLEEDAKPRWGKMTSRHMVEHLCHAFRMSNGKHPLPVKSNPDETLNYPKFGRLNFEK